MPVPCEVSFGGKAVDFMHICIHAYIHTYIQTYIHRYGIIRTHASAYKHASIGTYTNVRTYIRPNIHTSIVT